MVFYMVFTENHAPTVQPAHDGFNGYLMAINGEQKALRCFFMAIYMAINGDSLHSLHSGQESINRPLTATEAKWPQAFIRTLMAPLVTALRSSRLFLLGVRDLVPTLFEETHSVIDQFRSPMVVLLLLLCLAVLRCQGGIVVGDDQ